ncbi:MAG TPA: 3-hydroxyacyl-CoA dehydrogenase NAD-binding domain-containing protein [Bacteroidota bacterium]|nr:3-hydroxyacyl-CoA dehydrogenase NAD-binding domain-containing protein [Bacteroidota bacterium]
MFRHVGIVGAGTMGSGIAQATAAAGIDVSLYDVNETLLRQGVERVRGELKRAVQRGKLTPEELTAAMERIRLRSNISDLGSCDLVIEAVIEDLRVKKDLFRHLEKNAKPNTVLASNTSSLSITSMSNGLARPERLLGLHFFNPAHVMKLVEVVLGENTGSEVAESSRVFVKHIGKTPVTVKDTPGFVVNRIARPYYGEALRLLGENVATVEQIDRIAKSIGGFAMGPFELMDLIGIDVNFAVTASMYEQYFGEPRYRPHPIQKKMVDSGLLGKKSGQGFYRYKDKI